MKLNPKESSILAIDHQIWSLKEFQIGRVPIQTTPHSTCKNTTINWYPVQCYFSKKFTCILTGNLILQIHAPRNLACAVVRGRPTLSPNFSQQTTTQLQSIVLQSAHSIWRYHSCLQTWLGSSSFSCP